MDELTIISKCFAKAREVAKTSPLYIEKFKGLDFEHLMTKEQFQTLPFTDKDDLR